MSVENSKIIDAISVNPNDVVVLTIADHLPWDDQDGHLKTLQDKINAYLQFIEGGEIYDQYPNAKGKAYQIGIAFKFAPNQEGVEFLKKVKSILLESGYDLYYYQLDSM
jgi:hypothetical protein